MCNSHLRLCKCICIAFSVYPMALICLKDATCRDRFYNPQQWPFWSVNFLPWTSAGSPEIQNWIPNKVNLGTSPFARMGSEFGGCRIYGSVGYCALSAWYARRCSDEVFEVPRGRPWNNKRAYSPNKPVLFRFLVVLFVIILLSMIIS